MLSGNNFGKVFKSTQQPDATSSQAKGTSSTSFLRKERSGVSTLGLRRCPMRILGTIEIGVGVLDAISLIIRYISNL